MRLLLALATLLIGASAHAEYDQYGVVVLQGLARESGSINPPGLADVMVCNVNGSDRWLAIRSGPGTQYGIKRKLERLAIVTVNTENRVGRWIQVTTAYRQTDTNGWSLGYRKSLHVSGWAHDGYLCDYYFQN